MEPVGTLATFGIGLVAGILSGLIGIGGGVLMVPFLYFYYANPAWFGVHVRPDVATVVAHATSLFAIIPTSIRGAFAFHRARLVVWRAVWPIGSASIFAALLGARLATILPAPLLRVSFGALLMLSAVRLVRKRPRSGEAHHHVEMRLSLPITAGVGFATGLFSALLGVGGGIVAIPLLLQVVGIDVRRVAATSIGIIVLTSIGGTVAYMVSGAGEPGRPPTAVGYVDVAAGGMMFLGALVSVGWGTRLNQRLEARTLALVFAGVFLLIGVRLIATYLAQL
ncbi:MAG: sulfite exporter TauE/SafE family protein [Gemmatimonadota bacterium]|jgi:uncharacterized membrane protein YfcA|nr:sulfite exporter TauE/SafE family protein [Gemmatimonadota bacterium]